MAEPFLSEIRLMSFNFAPKGWALCNGQLLPINQNQALFALLGTTYGGDGRVNFALPDLRGRVPIYSGVEFTLGQRGGEDAHTVIQTEMPQHLHFPNATKQTANNSFIQVTAPTPSNNIPAVSSSAIYGPPNNLTTLEPSSISEIGRAHV